MVKLIVKLKHCHIEERGCGRYSRDGDRGEEAEAGARPSHTAAGGEGQGEHVTAGPDRDGEGDWEETGQGGGGGGEETEEGEGGGGDGREEREETTRGRVGRVLTEVCQAAGDEGTETVQGGGGQGDWH